MPTRAERDAQTIVAALLDSCAKDGADVPTRLRFFRDHEQRKRALLDSMNREMGKEPDAEAAAYARAVALEINRVLLELERPQAEA